MSAIFGIIDRLGHAIDPACAGRMLAALAHRGPDGCSSRSGPGFVLGHCLLDTAGTGPAMGGLLVEDDFIVVADCRIDNRDELVSALGVPTLASDTLIVLRAFQRWGEDLTSRLLGDFAFAIWNAREKMLVCARDHFGVKPFYYFCDAQFLVFASEPDAVLKSGLTKTSLTDDRLADFLAGRSPRNDETSFQDLLRLPPAHAGRLSASGWRAAAYWTLPKPAIRARADAAGEFRTILDQAVAARLRGIEIGTTLSGGLDSSSIACLARRQRDASGAGALPTFSMVFDETPEFSERPFIEAVLAQGGFAPCFIPSNRLAHFAELDDIVAEQQDLFLAPNIACSRQIYWRAREAGVRILLDGHGGDEVAPVGGGRLNELAAQGRWIELWRVLDGGIVEHDQRKWRAYWMFLKTYSPLRRPFGLARRVRRRLGLTRVKADPSMRGINPDFAARTGVVARSRLGGTGQPGRLSSEQDFHYDMLTGSQQSTAFEVLDRTAAAAGIEARYPFWDRRLVEFCLSLLPAEKLNDGWGRLILRRAMEGILPPAVQWRRTKFDFGRHVATSIIRDHTELVRQTLDDDRDDLSRYADLPAVRLTMERLRTSLAQPDGYDIQAIFRVMVLAVWLRRQHGRVPAAALA